jgi:Zn-dependent protease
MSPARKNPMASLSKKIHENRRPRNYDSPLPDVLIEEAYKLYIPLMIISVISIITYFFSPFNVGFGVFIVITIPSVIAHEYGHYTVFSHYEIPSEIYLAIFGGFVKPKGAMRLSSRKQMNISIMGCIFNYIIAGTAFLLSIVSILIGPSIFTNILISIGLVNILLASINILIPVSITDGGKLYRIWKKRRKKRNQTGVPPELR